MVKQAIAKIEEKYPVLTTEFVKNRSGEVGMRFEIGDWKVTIYPSMPFQDPLLFEEKEEFYEEIIKELLCHGILKLFVNPLSI